MNREDIQKALHLDNEISKRTSELEYTKSMYDKIVKNDYQGGELRIQTYAPDPRNIIIEFNPDVFQKTVLLVLGEKINFLNRLIKFYEDELGGL